MGGSPRSPAGVARTPEAAPKTVDSWPDFVASKERLAITIAPLDEGLLLDDPALALVAESPLFGQRVMQRRRREKRADGNNDAVIKNLTELREARRWCTSTTASAATWA